MVASFGVAGCPANVSGKVDDEDVGALMSAMFWQDHVDYGTDQTLYTLYGGATSMLGACDVATKRQLNFNDLLKTNLEDVRDADGDADAISKANKSFAEDLVAYDEQNLPTDYWQVATNLQALDDGLFDGLEQRIDLEDTDDSTLDPTDDNDAVANLTICRVNDHPSVDSPSDGVYVVQPDQDCYLAKKGKITVSKYDQDKAFTMTAEVELTPLKDDGTIRNIDDDAGKVQIDINAAYCKGLEDALQDEKDLVADEATP
jgi:hypothetical protein